MKAALKIWLIVASMVAASANAVADPEIVVAIRYLAAQGPRLPNQNGCPQLETNKYEDTALTFLRLLLVSSKYQK